MQISIAGKVMLCLCFACLINLPISVNAQSDESTVEYTIKREEPRDARNLHLLFYGFLDANRYNPALGLGTEFKISFNNKFKLDGTYQFARYDASADAWLSGYHAGGAPVGGGKRFRNMEFGGTYTIKQRIAAKEINVAYKAESTGYKEKTVYYFPYSVTRLYIIGARAGYQNLRTLVQPGSIKGYSFIADKTGTPEEFGSSSYSTMMNTHNISLGISRTIVTNLEMIVKGHGKKGRMTKTEMYADLLVAPVINYADMYVSGGSGSTIRRVSINNNTAKNHAGIRIGCVHYGTTVFGYIVGGEAGIRPGIGGDLQNNIFLNAKFGISLSAGVQ